MKFTLFEKGKCTAILTEQSAYSGVRKIADKVAHDIELVTGTKAEMIDEQALSNCKDASIILAATIGKSALLDELQRENKINVSACIGKREVYGFWLVADPLPGVKEAIVIAGSDKRGTIYGLFHVSELLNVSPWVDWADVTPKKLDTVVFDESVSMISKEPSVKFRGFFINDEWPAFGNWTFEHFNGFTAQMYDKVFELLLRLKGNYMWPAMWTSSFSLDGPGLANAELADEYGIVMGNSHHEPCLRHSEEWDMVRGENSIYGNEWNYYTNREGLLRYWEDGLKRNGKFENIITIGMRGERDSSMLGPDASLKQNIDLLKDIITEQRKLIAKHVGSNLDEIPQMLALYKEVEGYFYGDEQAEGLIDWDGIDGVTCMLCEDNFGNMRTLPLDKVKDRKGGWGMYYHFDYHGGPISYEWTNTSYLPKVWEQMTMAYDFGIRDIWIVNVGDLKFNEFPLNYFMDLAYDFETWGSNAPNCTVEYTNRFLENHFGAYFNETALLTMEEVLTGLTKLTHNRKTEAIYTDIYHPVHFSEGNRVLAQTEQLLAQIEELKAQVPEAIASAFYELIYFPTAAYVNVLRMQLFAGFNDFYAKQRAVIANFYADKITECIAKDRELEKEYHQLEDGKWNGMARSEHVGFIYWNDEECQYPLRSIVEPANKPRILVRSSESTMTTAGGDWTRTAIHMQQFMQYDCNSGDLVLSCGSKMPANYRIDCDCSGITFSKTEGSVSLQDFITVTIDRNVLSAEPHFFVRFEGGHVEVVLDVETFEIVDGGKNLFPIKSTYASIEANHFTKMSDSVEGAFIVLDGFGRTKAGVKAFPSNRFYTRDANAPSVEYSIYAELEGEGELLVYLAPANPVLPRGSVDFGLSINHGELQTIATVDEDYHAGESSCLEWAQGVLNQIHTVSVPVKLKKGENTITFFAFDPGFVLEKLVVTAPGYELPESYLGPEETFHF